MFGKKKIKTLQSRAAREKMERAAAAGPNRTRERVEVRFHRSFFVCVVLLRFVFFYLSLSLSARFFFDNEPNSRREEKCAR